MGKLPDVETVIAAIREMNGNLAAVGRKFGCTRQSVDVYVKSHATALAVCAEARESMLDNAESVLYKKVLAGETQELLFFLRTQGRKRGYGDKLEHTGKDGGPVRFTLTLDRPDSNDDTL